MSRKNNIRDFHSVVNGDMSDVIESAVTNIQYLDNIGIQLNFSGAPMGAFEVQVSIDYEEDNNGNVTNPGHWQAITLSPSPVAAGAGNIYIDMTQLSAPWIKVVYTPASGTGTLNAHLTAKTV